MVKIQRNTNTEAARIFSIFEKLSCEGGYSVTACLVNLVNRVYFKGGTFYEHSNGLPGNRPQSATFPAANRHPSF